MITEAEKKKIKLSLVDPWGITDEEERLLWDLYKSGDWLLYSIALERINANLNIRYKGSK